MLCGRTHPEDVSARGYGEGRASAFFRTRSIAASKTNNNNGLYIFRPRWLPHASAIFDLLRPSTRIPRGHAPPYGQTPPGPHPAAHRLAPHAAPHRLAPNGRGSTAAKQHALPLMLAHLDKAQWDASPPPLCLISATATPLRSPPHPLQMCRSNLSTTSLHLVGRVARSWSSHTRALVLPFVVVLSAPEGWWSGGCGVPALHLKRGERGRVPASRR